MNVIILYRTLTVQSSSYVCSSRCFAVLGEVVILWRQQIPVTSKPKKGLWVVTWRAFVWCDHDESFLVHVLAWHELKCNFQINNKRAKLINNLQSISWLLYTQWENDTSCETLKSAPSPRRSLLNPATTGSSYFLVSLHTQKLYQRRVGPQLLMHFLVLYDNKADLTMALLKSNVFKVVHV